MRWGDMSTNEYKFRDMIYPTIANRCSVQYLCKLTSFPGIYINKLTLYYDAIISGQRPIRG